MFTEEQQQKIRSEYLDKSILELAKELGCSGQTVARFMKKNNLKLPKHIIQQRKSKNQFKKGVRPHNKGLKWSDYMTQEGIKILKKTTFKKGSQPKNTKEPNTVFYRTKLGEKFKCIKTEDGRIVRYNRYVWEQHYGEIPKDYNVVFKDGNTDNFDISNLECVSNEEKMLRNSWQKHPKEIIPSMALLCKLNKQIKKD